VFETVGLSIIASVDQSTPMTRGRSALHGGAIVVTMNDFDLCMGSLVAD